MARVVQAICHGCEKENRQASLVGARDALRAEFHRA
jgi:hypothetical protein